MNIPSSGWFIGQYEPFKSKGMNKTWRKVAAVVLAALLLWWLFWAILADEDINEMEMQNTEIVE